MDSKSDAPGRKWFTVDELAAMELPGFPRSGRRWHDRAKADGWPSRQVPSQGRTGARTEYSPPASVAALIDATLASRKEMLANAFDEYRLSVGAGEPLQTAIIHFVDDYNEQKGLAKDVPGFRRITDANVEEALGLKAPLLTVSQDRAQYLAGGASRKANLAPPADLLVKAFFALMEMSDIPHDLSIDQRTALTMRLFDLLMASCGTDPAKLARVVDDPEALKAALRLAWAVHRAHDAGG